MHLVVLVLAGSNLESWLVVTHLSRLPQDSDVSWRVHFLQDHLDLVEQSQCIASLLLHNAVDQARVKLDVQVSEGWLQLLEVLHLRADVVLLAEVSEVLLLVELVEQLAKQVTACEVAFKIRDWLQ